MGWMRPQRASGTAEGDSPPARDLSEFRGQALLRLIALGLLLLALGCAGRTSASLNSPHLESYEAQPASLTFGPPGG